MFTTSQIGQFSDNRSSVVPPLTHHQTHDIFLVSFFPGQGGRGHNLHFVLGTIPTVPPHIATSNTIMSSPCPPLYFDLSALLVECMPNDEPMRNHIYKVLSHSNRRFVSPQHVNDSDDDDQDWTDLDDMMQGNDQGDTALLFPKSSSSLSSSSSSSIDKENTATCTNSAQQTPRPRLRSMRRISTCGRAA